MSGKLYIIATPVGNLDDISRHMINALQESDFILAEDTRVTIKLLNHLQIKKKMFSCHEHNEAARHELLSEAAASGQTVALVSDAGTPLVSDPGDSIVSRAIELAMEIHPVAGPSAFLLALVCSGLPCGRFSFEGYLPDKAGERKRHLLKLKDEERTLIFYIPPHDLLLLLQEIAYHLGDRKACLARELTKLHEEFRRGTLAELIEYAAKEKVRGECVLVVSGGAPGRQEISADEIKRSLALLLDRGEGLKRAAAAIAEECGWSRSAVYKLGIEYLDNQRAHHDKNKGKQ